ncbi:4-diphosphocytidyl-2-C-methyl-D-erythritol kinase [Neisseria gonorrhoeae]|uniref:4-diphosphocytidyl-2-C-methyl-D-erythritol kinase n=1 Tax=Neisseria gonorrhoeae TaxID=485 RepID=A0A378VZ56_NEIGO|nr:4-diphosphocytidyl-2-C-methyl-D-erythritol kinase [Neisseria gonorrhoeae]
MNIADGRQAFPAPAKLNLDLRITGRREDGYHNIESIFCLIDLQDTVYLKPRDDGKIILHNPVGGIPQEADLSYRAASLLQKYARNLAGVEIWLDKKSRPAPAWEGGVPMPQRFCWC